MLINDRIYGEIEVTEPLIIDLLNSGPMQRLKKISQDGATHFIQPVFDGNRFEHSFGVWYLSHRFNRPLEEQIACLLHDVPHTAFSHVIDFVMEDHDQEYHDRFLKKVVLDSDIPEICQKHGLDIHQILRKEDYYLLDNKLPELSFDRWDYFMRDAFMIGILPREVVELIIASAKIKGGQFYFTDARVAGLFSIATLSMAQLGYVSATSHGAWFLFATALKIALKENIITEEDLFTTDDIVMAKLNAADNKEVNEYLMRLQPGKEFVYASKDEAEFYGRNKARFIDPLVMQDGKLVNVSELIPSLRARMEIFKAECQNIGVKQVE